MAETSLALIQRTAQHVVETRFKQGVRITVEGLSENIEARLKICSNVPHAMLTVLPPAAEFDSDILRPDHQHYVGPRATLVAIAVVTEGPMMSMIARLYFAHFPKVSRTRIFDSESEARDWLDRQLDELGFSGN